MPAIRENHYLESARRSSFNGKDLTFVEIIFDNGVAGTALDTEGGSGTPDAYNSPFWRIGEFIRTRATILAQSYELAAVATTGDATLVTDITAADSIDVFTFLLEGSDLFGDGEAAQVTAVDAAVLTQLAAGGLEAGVARPAIVGVDATSVGTRVSTLRFLSNDVAATAGVGFPNARD